ncbi:hypothetical protein [Streptomyces sp. NPDC046371]|uniref:hypothetical protein n=1 Tax=Streptomyces sp. NPDC046371 TaxID=3154916 RepID=UPI0033C6E407
MATRPARETGYRDGARAGTAAAKARAYRDGVNDGWKDALAKGEEEKARLDQARDLRKTQQAPQPTAPPKPTESPKPTGPATTPKAPAKPQPSPQREPAASPPKPPATPTPAPKQAPPSPGGPKTPPAPDTSTTSPTKKDTPVKPPPVPSPEGSALPPTVLAPATPMFVTGITATAVTAEVNGHSVTMPRGELRTFKGYEQRLTARRADVRQIAEEMRMLSHAADQALRDMQKLCQAAKAVNGGEKLVAKLARLEDTARLQANQAQATYERAVKAADAASAVLSNVVTRYSGIYQAVVDSDETSPAELRFYRNAQGS